MYRYPDHIVLFSYDRASSDQCHPARRRRALCSHNAAGRFHPQTQAGSAARHHGTAPLGTCGSTSPHAGLGLERRRQSLPDFYIPPMFDPDTPQRAPQSDGHFGIGFVNKIVTYLSMLVVMGIDKCTSRCLIMRPQHFERYLDEIFPVERDPVHFTPLPLTFSAVARSMRSEYMASKFNLIATWNPQCAASIPYPLV